MIGIDYFQMMQSLWPEIALVITAAAVLGFDQFCARGLPLESRWRGGVLIAGIGMLAAMTLVVLQKGAVEIQDGMLISNPVVRLLKLAILAMAFFCACLSLQNRESRHAGEYVILLLLATLGLLILVSSDHLLMIFIALELASLSFYVLAGFQLENRSSAEAALKYFLFGGVSSAFLLFGLSLLYGLSGELLLHKMTMAWRANPQEPLLVLALVMVVIGLGFKIAAAPFHVWAPDVYQGAPIPTAAFVASASKVGGFLVLARVMWSGFSGLEGSAAWQAWAPGWVPLLAVLAVVSMVWGNLAALSQTSVRRLLAYSAIAHSGYMLLGLIAADPRGISALVYYVITYGLTTLGAFGVVAVAAPSGNDHWDAFAGLARRSPGLSFCMLVFILSLAGIPPLAGFFGKVYLFVGALNSQTSPHALLWLVAVALGTSVVSFYYYLQLLKQIYVTPPSENLPAICPQFSVQFVLGILAVFVFVLGLFPEVIMAKTEIFLMEAGW